VDAEVELKERVTANGIAAGVSKGLIDARDDHVRSVEVVIDCALICRRQRIAKDVGSESDSAYEGWKI
jgi:hypothetical protein